jgi:uncharacterized membrane protein
MKEIWKNIEGMVRLIRNSSTIPQNELAKIFRISKANISLIVHNKHWKTI